MDKKFKQFLKEKAIPVLEDQLNLARFNNLRIEFKMEKLEKEFEKAKEIPVLESSKWNQQLEEHNLKRSQLEREIENLKKQKEENLREIEDIKSFIKQLEEKIK